MRELLTKLNGGEAPTEVEVQLIVDSVDKRGGTSDGAINKDELKEAMLEWRNYKVSHIETTASEPVRQ